MQHAVTSIKLETKLILNIPFLPSLIFLFSFLSSSHFALSVIKLAKRLLQDTQLVFSLIKCGILMPMEEKCRKESKCVSEHDQQLHIIIACNNVMSNNCDVDVISVQHGNGTTQHRLLVTTTQ